MEACWKPGRSHRKLMRKTAESRTLEVSMASVSPRGGGTGREERHGAAGQRPGPGSSGGLGVRGAGSQPHKSRPCHAPSRPSPRGEGRGRRGGEGRGGEGGRRGRVVWAGGVGERGPLWAGVAGEGPRSAPAGRARGCRAVRAERGPARRAGGGARGRSAARKPGSSAAPEPLQLCSKLGLAAATRCAGSRSSPSPPPSRPPSRTTTNSVASTWLGACSPGRRQAAAAPPRDSSEQASLQPTARRLRAVVPSFPGPSLPGQSIAPPQWPAQGPGKPLAAHASTPGVGLRPEQPRSLAGVTAFHKDQASVPDPRGHAKATSL